MKPLWLQLMWIGIALMWIIGALGGTGDMVSVKIGLAGFCLLEATR